MNSARSSRKTRTLKAYNPTAAQLLEAAEKEVEDADTFTRRQKIVIGFARSLRQGIMIETFSSNFTAAAGSVYILNGWAPNPGCAGAGLWELLRPSAAARA